MSDEEKSKEQLSEEEIQKLLSMDYQERNRWYPRGSEQERIRNTIEALESDLKSVKGLKRFIETGVLVNDQLILACSPDDFRANIYLRALSSGDFQHSTAQIKVPLRLKDAERLLKMLPEAIKAAKKKRSLIKLKELMKQKSSRRY